MTKGKDTNVLATLPIETKLTRGEVVEMLIEQLVGDLTMRRERLDAEYKELSKLSPSELKKLDLVGSLGIRYDGKLCIHSSELALETVPAWLAARVERLRTVGAERRKIDDMRGKLYDKGAAKNAILRKLLESSENGRTILEQIGKFRIGMQKQLEAAVEAEMAKKPSR